MATSVVTASVVAVLKTVPPFQFLPETELEGLAGSICLEYFPQHTLILAAGSKASASLYVVKKGGVKLTLPSETGEEIVFDVRSEGEIFGLLSIFKGDVVRLDVTAVEDTLCYSIPWPQVQRLISEHPEFAAYLLRTSVTRYMDHALAEMRARARPIGEGERLLYSLAVSDVARKPALVCSGSASVRDAARQMSGADASSCVFIAGPDGRAVGILTDRDLTEKVIARGLPLDAPVTQIMTSPAVSVESGERVFQVLLKMLAHDIHHVLVTENGLPKSAVTYHDLMMLQGKSPLYLARNIEQQHTVDDLVSAQQATTDLIPLLMREGAKAGHITRVVAEINDRIMVKILELAHAQLGPAPVPYCWVALGSEGRREQTLKTDQDNALILAGPPDLGAPAQEYFARLAAFAQDALARCGYPSCLGGFMASNPRWRKGVTEWMAEFEHWIKEPVQRGVQNALIFFDMRPVAGDFSLFEELRRRNRDLLATAGFFKSILAFVSINHKPPLGFFRTLVVEHSGEHKDELDLKLFGTWPIVSAARLFALDAGIDQTNTADRLSALEALEYEDRVMLRDLQEAFEFLTVLRLERQLEQRAAGQPINNYISPVTLSNLQKSLLKEAFQTILRAQSAIEKRFKSAVWAQLA
jgi:CBS domain-containing protein